MKYRYFALVHQYNLIFNTYDYIDVSLIFIFLYPDQAVSKLLRKLYYQFLFKLIAGKVISFQNQSIKKKSKCLQSIVYSFLSELVFILDYTLKRS
jgi:hypothetical protein